MKSLKVLDVTLRDGGCVNDFNFGQVYMDKILKGLEESQVDIIELGYIDENKGSEKDRTQYINEKVIPEHFLKTKKKSKTYVAMIDYGKFDVNKLSHRTDNGIDGIRLVFHKKDIQNMIKSAKTILEKGYELFIQPMLTMRYTDKELLELIEIINTELPNSRAFYIVDSFGEMRANDMERIINLVDHNLNKDITIGFHSHNNLQLSYSNAISLIQFSTTRDLIIDASIMGMGKGAGNLNTELLLEHLNLFYGKNYNIAPLLKVIDEVINQIHSEFYWGYSVEYYLSSINHCTPSYAKHFYNKHMLSIEQVSELLSMISEEKKISFDKEYAEALYCEYNGSKAYEDTKTINKLRELIEGKEVLVIAPGRSILKEKDKIEEVLRKKDVISINLNNYKFDSDIIFTTRLDAFEEVKKHGKTVIVTSNVSKDSSETINVIDYKKWIVNEDEVHDSSGIVVLNLLKELRAAKIYLAGFDGFSANINNNYYDKTLSRTVTDNEANKRNSYYKAFIDKARRTMEIEFLTPSLYEDIL